METARAFGASLLKAADPTNTVDDLKRNLGTEKICSAVDALRKVRGERQILKPHDVRVISAVLTPPLLTDNCGSEGMQCSSSLALLRDSKTAWSC